MYLIYNGKSIEVLEEHEAYSFLSLVADIGGVLGMFIGFNFLMVWDWMIIAMARLPFNTLCFKSHKTEADLNI